MAFRVEGLELIVAQAIVDCDGRYDLPLILDVKPVGPSVFRSVVDDRDRNAGNLAGIGRIGAQGVRVWIGK